MGFSECAGSGGTDGDEEDTAGTGSIEPAGNVKFNLFFDIFYVKKYHQRNKSILSCKIYVYV